MHLYLMRHGAAEDRAATGRDFDRSLTAQGRADVRRGAEWLLVSRGGMPVLRVVSSPLCRARETAEIVAEVAGLPGHEIEERDELAVDEPPAESLVRELGIAGRDTLVVGHQPAIEVLARRLVARAPPELRSGFRTAMIVALEAKTPSEWRAIGVFDPRG